MISSNFSDFTKNVNEVKSCDFEYRSEIDVAWKTYNFHSSVFNFLFKIK